MLDMGAAHLHPLNYALGLARAAQTQACAFMRAAHVQHIDEGSTATVQTDSGRSAPIT